MQSLISLTKRGEDLLVTYTGIAAGVMTYMLSHNGSRGENWLATWVLCPLVEKRGHYWT